LPREFTCSRAGNTATRVNQNGNIEVVNADVPRIDYFGGQASLLVEPAATNLFFRSEEFNDAYWTKTNLNTTGTPPWVNVATAPDGTMTAEKLIANTANSTHSINRTGLTSGSYTFSVFAKAGEETILSLWLVNNTIRGQFDLSNGTIQFSSAGVSSKIEPYGNGWYRCSVYSSVATTTASIYMRIGGSFEGNDTNGFFIWGAQLETGSVATSYIPTTTGPVTRDADVINKTSIASLIGQAEGTIYAEVDIRTFANLGVIASISDGTANNRLELYKASDKIYFDRLSSIQSTTTSISSTSTYSPGILKIAVAYKSGDTIMYINGSPAVTTQTPTFTFSLLTRMNVGSSRADIAQFNDRIRTAEIYPTRLPNVAPPGVLSLQSLTAI
jgi:hypothetical protein